MGKGIGIAISGVFGAAVIGFIVSYPKAGEVDGGELSGPDATNLRQITQRDVDGGGSEMDDRGGIAPKIKVRPPPLTPEEELEVLKERVRKQEELVEEKRAALTKFIKSKKIIYPVEKSNRTDLKMQEFEELKQQFEQEQRRLEQLKIKELATEMQLRMSRDR